LKPLNASEVLELWEETSGQTVLAKSLSLLSKACSTEDFNQLGHLSIGERDARLLQLREWMFGTVLRSKFICPNCAETIEWESDSQGLHLQSFSEELFVREFFLETDGYSIRFRLPDSFDIAKILQADFSESIAKKILAGCITNIIKDKEQHIPGDLPESVWNALNDRMSEEDPQADIRMELTCPGCKHSWESCFDIGSYLWTEINNWAQHILHEVYLLAKAFNWSEKDILNMSANRRQLYIEMLGA
jgi:hypothetical protein